MEVREPSAKYLAAIDHRLTEIGLLPDDWSAQRLGNVSTCVIGLTYSPADVAGSGTLVLRSSNIQDGRLAFSDCVYVQMALPDRVITREGDLLVCVRNGSRSLIGKAALIHAQAAGSAFGAFMSVLRSNDGPFLRQVFDTALLKRQIEQGMGATINQITNRDMDALLVPWPSSAEERRLIGSVLVEADALIDSLEQLLTKKRQIKQGAMQELLTGKRRLPGFQQPWSEFRLGEIGRTYGGLTGKGKADFGHGASKYITFMNVMTNVRTSTEMIERVQVGPSESQNMVRAGDLLFNGSSETPEEVALCSWVENCDDDVFLNSFCFGFRPFTTDRLSGLFMAYFFRGRPGRAAVSSLAQGATRYNIAKTALLQAPLHLPCFAEQQAIAEVLSSVDTEITALESRITKARALKQAMAQALLTGRIRLLAGSGV
jgi:type I restriction enzyme, S subunit